MTDESPRSRRRPQAPGMMKPLNLKLVLTLAISLLAFGLTGVVTLAIGEAGIGGIEASISTSLALLANQMQDKLDHRAYERLREIGVSARLLGMLDMTEKPDAIRLWLEQLRSSREDYAWIGLVNKGGVVTEATDGRRVGEDVSQTPWFRAAMQAPTVRDADDKSPEKGGPVAFRTEAGHVLEIAQPVIGPGEQAVGVLAAQIDWNWVGEIRDSVIGSLKRDHGVDIIVLNSSGAVILGPSALLGRTLQVTSRASPMAQDGVFEGQHYLFAYAKIDGHRKFRGLGWSVLVRQDVQIALAPVRELQNVMILCGAGFSLLAALAAWAVAGRIAAPLLRLAQAAQNIQRGADMRMPEFRGYAEAEVLSRSFALLVSDLKHRERALASLNETLEAQVSERTSELAAQNVALAMAYQEAEKATEAKSRFLAAASHDLRQPLHAMSLFVRALSRRVSGEEAPRLVGQLEEALTSLRGMFEALLNISRLDAGLIQPSPAEIQVKALVERVSSGFRAEAESKGLRFLSRSVDAQLYADPALLETMLRNLVSNALKFTRRGGVALIARRTGDAVAFEVIDTGPGIAEERRERIFEEFERAREQAIGHNEGLGLGLSIVRRYAALLASKVSVSSRIGHGTRFTLIVPRAKLLGRQAGFDGHRRKNGETKLPPGLRVLVLDDDPVIVSALARDLADRGCDVQGATSPAAAEAILNAAPGIDAMILDFDLGGAETGLDFFARMNRSFARPTPALILTGGTSTATLAAILASQLSWLTKPAEPDMIAEALVRLVENDDMHVAVIDDPVSSDRHAKGIES